MNMKILDAGKDAPHNCAPFGPLHGDVIRDGMKLQCDECEQVWAVKKRPVYGGWVAERVPPETLRRILKTMFG